LTRSQKPWHATATLAPDRPRYLIPLVKALALPAVTLSADGLAVAWYALAPLPDGRCAVAFGGWCQGVGTLDHPWAAYPTRADCFRRFRDMAADLCTWPVSGLARVQEKARVTLLEKLDAHVRENS
jgi:hypothetical protein